MQKLHNFMGKNCLYWVLEANYNLFREIWLVHFYKINSKFRQLWSSSLAYFFCFFRVPVPFSFLYSADVSCERILLFLVFLFLRGVRHRSLIWSISGRGEAENIKSYFYISSRRYFHPFIPCPSSYHFYRYSLLCPISDFNKVKFELKFNM